MMSGSNSLNAYSTCRESVSPVVANVNEVSLEELNIGGFIVHDQNALAHDTE